MRQSALPQGIFRRRTNFEPPVSVRRFAAVGQNGQNAVFAVAEDGRRFAQHHLYGRAQFHLKYMAQSVAVGIGYRQRVYISGKAVKSHIALCRTEKVRDGIARRVAPYDTVRRYAAVKIGPYPSVVFRMENIL